MDRASVDLVEEFNELAARPHRLYEERVLRRKRFLQPHTVVAQTGKQEGQHGLECGSEEIS